jgi:hypothetical protein
MAMRILERCRTTSCNSEPSLHGHEDPYVNVVSAIHLARTDDLVLVEFCLRHTAMRLSSSRHSCLGQICERSLRHMKGNCLTSLQRCQSWQTSPSTSKAAMKVSRIQLRIPLELRELLRVTEPYRSNPAVNVATASRK